MLRIVFTTALILGYAIAPYVIEIIYPIKIQAQTIAELEARIETRNKDIAALEKEIAQYQSQIVKTNQEAKTLKELISTLETTRKKLDADIALTQNKIQTANLTIAQLRQKIAQYESEIEINQKGIETALKSIYRQEQTPLITSVLGSSDIIDIWHNVKELNDFNLDINKRIVVLEDLKIELDEKQKQQQIQKNNLSEQQNTLSDQKKVVEYNKAQQNKVLTETQNKEALYQKQLAEKKALRDAFQKELDLYESQLRIAIDPNSYPSPRRGVLLWPLDKVILTQYFGNTAFATANAAVYGGKGHNGIDLGASIGTKIKAPLSGTVMGSGNTDNTCPNASYGKWVLLKHDNGLSTLYAHLSVISVESGQKVSTGQIIGYTGNTGYSTGPHLHFTVYASQGVQLVNRPSSACGGKTYYIPVADYKAYLNPLSYLPAL